MIYGTEDRRDLGELKRIHEQVMQAVESGKEQDDDDGGVVGWFSRFFNFNKTETPSLLNGNFQQNQNIPPEQQALQSQTVQPQTQGWNALNTAEFIQNISRMPTEGAADNNTVNTTNNVNSVNPQPVCSTNTTATAVTATGNNTVTPLPAATNTTVNTNPNVNYQSQSQSTTVPEKAVVSIQDTAAETEKEARLEKEAAQSEKVAKLEKSEQLMEAEIKKMKESRDEEQTNRLRRRRRQKRFRRLLRRHLRHQSQQKQQIVFDPIPGLFPKVLVNRILKEREVEVIVHGPKGNVVRTNISGEPIA